MISQYLVDVMTRHQVYLERLKTGVDNKFDPTIIKLDRMIRQVLAQAGVTAISDLSRTSLNSLIREIQSEERDLLGDYAKKLSDELSGISEYEASFVTTALKRGIVDGAKRVKPAPYAEALVYARSMPIQATGMLLEGFMQNWEDREVMQVSAVLRNAHAQGWSMQEAILAIRGTKAKNYQDGVLQRIDNETESVVRTAIQHVSNSSRLAVYEANDDIVVGYRFIATLDSRTSQQCRSLDQQVFKLGKGPLPPLHVRCRSTTVAELSENEELEKGATRASKGEEGGQPVDASLSYYDWLKTQPADFQDTAIGPTRGKLFRDGGLSADEFARLNIGRTFEPLTLPEMRALAPTAFERAGI